MALRDAIKGAAKAAVDAVGDVAVSTNYEAFASTTYNASAGTNTPVYSTTAGVKVVFDEFRLEQIDGQNVKPEDKMALVPAKSISAVTPKTNDRIVENGATWNVQDVRNDPAEALWTLHVRRP